MSELGHEHHGWARTFDDTVDKNGRVAKNLTVSVMPEILEMRKEWKKEYGNTRVFDYFYMGLRDKIVAHHIKSMKEWRKLDKEIEKAEKNTWLFVEEEAQ